MRYIHEYQSYSNIGIDYVLQASEDEDGIINKKKLEVAICEMKLKLLKDNCQDMELMEVIDIMEVITIYSVEDSAHDFAKSEISYYKDVSRILDIIMRNTTFKMKE